MVNVPFLAVLAGCSARRSECGVASHTSEEQRRNAPVSAVENGILAVSASLKAIVSTSTQVDTRQRQPKPPTSASNCNTPKVPFKFTGQWLLKRWKFGRSREQLNGIQVSWFDETLESDIAAIALELKELAPVAKTEAAPRQQPKRAALPVGLPRVAVHHEPDSTTCGCGYAYIKDALTRLPRQKNSQIDELLPHRWQPIKP